MHELKRKLMDELMEYEKKGELSAGSLDAIHKLTDTIKNIDKIELLETDGGYSSGVGTWSARGMYDGKMSDYRGDGGESYAKKGQHYVRGHYSRFDAKEAMLAKLTDMLEMAENDRQRDAIRSCIRQLESI